MTWLSYVYLQDGISLGQILTIASLDIESNYILNYLNPAMTHVNNSFNSPRYLSLEKQILHQLYIHQTFCDSDTWFEFISFIYFTTTITNSDSNTFTLALMSSFVWSLSVGGNRSTQRKPTFPLGDHMTFSRPSSFQHHISNSY